MKKYFTKTLNEEHNGLAMTIEVVLSLLFAAVIVTSNVQIIRVSDAQRLMSTVATSTASIASRWGGTNSNAYRLNISRTPFEKTANDQLRSVLPEFSPKITYSQDSCPKGYIKLTYTFPNYYLYSILTGGGNTKTLYIYYSCIQGEGILR